jgi:hypothetical protein
MRSRFTVVSVLVLLSGLLTLGPLGDRPVTATCSPEHYIQKDAAPGGVQITITYVTPEYVAMTKDRQRMKPYMPDRYALFLIQLDSHSVDVSGYNLVQLGRLTGGRATRAPLRWVETAAGTHHRTGLLMFPRISPRLPATMVLTRIAGVPARSYCWKR